MPSPYHSETPGDAPRIRIEFADGTVWSYADIAARAEIQGDSVQNTIVADPGNPTL
jgi:hypothetical protein